MAFRFFTVPIKDAAAAEAELNAFVRSHRILTVDRRWVDSGVDSFWALCVDYMSPEERVPEELAYRLAHTKIVRSDDRFATPGFRG